MLKLYPLPVSALRSPARMRAFPQSFARPCTYVYVWHRIHFLLERNSDRGYMLEHNRVMNVSNKDWIHVNRFIRSASPKGLSQDRISKVDTIAGLKPVIVVYLPACVLNRIVLPGVCVLRMLENFGRGFHPEVEGDDVINSGVVAVRHLCLYAAR